MIPVADVDRAKSIYADQIGFNVDHDTKVSDEVRVVQLTPEGSGCSVVIGKGVAQMAPGSLNGLQRVVAAIQAARAELVGRGVDIGEVQVLDGDLSRLERGERPWTTSGSSSSTIRTATAGPCNRSRHGSRS